MNFTGYQKETILMHKKVKITIYSCVQDIVLTQYIFPWLINLGFIDKYNTQR